MALKTASTPLKVVGNKVSPGSRVNEMRRLSKSYDVGLELAGYGLKKADYSMFGSLNLSSTTSPHVHISSSRLNIRRSLFNKTHWSSPSWKDFSEVDLTDPLRQLREQAHTKIKARIAQERRLALVMCLLICVFTLCFLPFWSVYVSLAFCASCSPPPPQVLVLVHWLALFNSLINPIIYTVFNKEFNKSIKKTLRRILCSFHPCFKKQ